MIDTADNTTKTRITILFHRSPLIAAAGMAGACLLPAAGHAEPLDVKTGLWQIETSFDMQGDLGISAEALAAMPPAQQTQIKAAMANLAQTMKKPHTSQKCVTAAELERGLQPHQRPNEQCKTNFVTKTAKLMEMQETCTGEGSRSGTLRFEAIDRETIAGSGHFTMDRNGKPSAGDLTVHGKFLSPACGDVKPTE